MAKTSEKSNRMPAPRPLSNGWPELRRAALLARSRCALLA
jgi:hypothetical protein